MASPSLFSELDAYHHVSLRLVAAADRLRVVMARWVGATSESYVEETARPLEVLRDVVRRWWERETIVGEVVAVANAQAEPVWVGSDGFVTAHRAAHGLADRLLLACPMPEEWAGEAEGRPVGLPEESRLQQCRAAQEAVAEWGPGLAREIVARLEAERVRAKAYALDHKIVLEVPGTGSGVRIEKDVWLARAMLLIRDHPDWSDAEIAHAVKKHPGTLSRSPQYRAAAAMARERRGDLRRGHVTTDPETGRRDVEAYAERDWDG